LANLNAQASLAMPASRAQALTRPLSLQLSHLALSCVWNLAGVDLISRGLAPLGPTASLATTALLIGVGLLMIIGAKKNVYLYLLCSVLAMAGAGTAIAGAFSQNPSLWPSDVWRLSGVGLNCLALIGGFWGFIKLYTAPKK
jgi:hypothetical protein